MVSATPGRFHSRRQIEAIVAIVASVFRGAIAFASIMGGIFSYPSARIDWYLARGVRQRLQEISRRDGSPIRSDFPDVAIRRR
jgi:hypothetical protein